MPSLRDIMELGRMHTAAATATVPTAGCLTAGGGWEAALLVAAASLLHHGWGFSMNEILDQEIDGKSGDLTNKPLVSGKVSSGQARVVSASFLILSGTVFIVAAFMTGAGILSIAAPFLLSTALGSLYNIYGKKVPLMDIPLSGWMFFLVVTGAYAGGGDAASFPVGVWAVAIMGALHILYNNSVEGGMKDVDNDRSQGSRTLAVVSGACYDGQKMSAGPAMRIWAVLLRVLFAVSGMVFSLFIASEAGWGEWIVVLVSILGLLLISDSMSLMIRDRVIKRRKLLGRFAVHEIGSFAFTLLVIMPVLGPWWVMGLFILPLLWFMSMNRLLYGNGMVPGV